MVKRFNPPRDLDWKPLPMRPDIAGQYVRYSDLTASRSEIERLRRMLDLRGTGPAERYWEGRWRDEAAENERLTKERDEARAQVAAAYEVAAQAKVFMAEEGGFLTRVPLLPETKAAIRTLTPADAQAALAAYGRSKVQEGMQRVIDRLRHEGQINPSLTYADAIEWAEYALADMETLK